MYKLFYHLCLYSSILETLALLYLSDKITNLMNNFVQDNSLNIPSSILQRLPLLEEYVSFNHISILEYASRFLEYY